MKREKNLFVIMLFAGLLAWAMAAKSQSPEHEPSLKWRTMTTPHFSVHFPAGYEELGDRVAALCEEAYEPVSRSLNYFPHRTHVVVRTRIDYLDGFVNPLPWRMELSVTEPQINLFGSRDEWMRILIAHEFTHVVQLRKHKGLSTLTYPLFGELNSFWQGNTPRWYIEGFATFNETRLTQGGRGRNPYHWMQMMAPLKVGKPWRLENTNFGSRKRMPQFNMQYVSGYYLSHFVHQRYGPQAWAKILDRYSALPLRGFGGAAKSVTGKSLKQLYREMLAELSNEEVKRDSFAPPTQIWHKPNRPEDQLSPRWVDRDHLLIYRKSFDDLPELAEMDRTGNRRQIRQRQFHFTLEDNSFTAGKKVLVWAEPQVHPRFSATVYSDLKLYDRQTANVRPLTHNARVYCPDLAPDETQVSAVQNFLGTSALVTATLPTGEINTLLKIPHSLILNPRWSPDGKWIAFGLKDSTGRQDIAVLEVKTGRWRYLYSPDIFHDNNPGWTPNGRYVLYASDRSGIFNIWAVEVATEKRWQVTDAELGAFTPDVSPDGRELAFSSYTYTGFAAATMSLDSTRWLQEQAVQPYTHSLTFPTGEGVKNPPSVLPAKTTSYHPWGQILRPQGWIPLPYEDEYGIIPGVFAMSRDALHRHAWQGLFALSPKDLRPSVDFNYSYRRWWPTFDIRAFYLPDEVAARGESGWWRKRGLQLTAALPLILESNVDFTFFQPFFGARLEDSRHSTGNIFPSRRDYRGVQLGFGFNRSAQAWRDVAPQRALNIFAFADWSSSALGSEFSGHQYSGLVNTFRPTPIRHHQLELLGMYQNRAGEFDYDFFGALPIGHDDDHRPQQLRLKGAYHFPVAYPEWSTPFLPIYFDYLAGALFYDWGTSWEKGFDLNKLRERDRYSTGVQLTFSAIWFRVTPVRLGAAFYYRSEDRAWRATPLFAIDFGF